jgi:N-acetylglucosaminyl-diphospho-decaprenol L-rhamnosyltransferase
VTARRKASTAAKLGKAPKTAPNVSVVVINHNSGPRLAACLAAIPSAAPTTSFDVLVVDNASTDGSADFLRGDPRSPMRLVEPEANLLFTGGANLGIHESRGSLVLLLNPDMVPAPGSIDDLAACFENPSVAAASGCVLRRDGEVERRYLRRLPTVWSWYVQSFRSSRRADRSRAFRHYAMVDADLSRRTDVPQPGGGCLMVRRSWLADGLAPADVYGVYFSDVDLARRIADGGGRIVFLPQARFLHDHADVRTTTGRAWRVSADYYVGALRYFRRWHGRAAGLGTRMLLLWGLLWRLAHKSIAVPLGREPRQAWTDHVKVLGAVLRGRNPLLEARA